MSPRRLSCLVASSFVIGGLAAAQADARSVYWGALALDRVGEVEAGLSYNQPTQTRAIKAALADCRGDGGDHCRKVVAFKNACGAMYMRPKDRRVGWGVAFDLSAAKSRARRECGSGSCVMVAYSCTKRWR